MPDHGAEFLVFSGVPYALRDSRFDYLAAHIVMTNKTSAMFYNSRVYK